MKAWSDIGFEIEITGDHSPSLRLLQSVDPLKDRGESMHHSGGACAETLLIYGEPIKETLKKIEKPHFLIVGLGLGYIESVIAREALLQNKNAADVGLITSYESVPELRDFFFQWIHGETHSLHSEVINTYEQMLESVIGETGISPETVKSFLCEHFRKLSDISGSLSKEAKLVSKYHCILYDAFSSKTSPFLWEEEFLNSLLEQVSASQCVLSTYACKGSLKRALKSHGFEVIVREGFQGKRNSTLAMKNF
ncbi:MnmC family methyltransferase [Bdellovibrio sp. HCB117]|uniref:MnmC family methyltransferase n=1 Tax=Bdellovibrio sp. HCB117 TaxID=3394359 RepID=UPI0039B4C460